jgi:hypothetical protein
MLHPRNRQRFKPLIYVRALLVYRTTNAAAATITPTEIVDNSSAAVVVTSAAAAATAAKQRLCAARIGQVYFIGPAAPGKESGECAVILVSGQRRQG